MAEEDQSAQEQAQHAGSGRGFVNQQLGALPIGSLIMAPIMAAAEGQEELCNKYLNFIMKLAYDTDHTGSILGGIGGVIGEAVGTAEAGPVGGAAGKAIGTGVGQLFGQKAQKTKVLKFKLDRPQVNPDGTITNVSTEINAPMLSLVPLPAFTMDEVVVDFTMDVSDQLSTSNTYDTSTTTATSDSNQGTKHAESQPNFWENLVGLNGNSSTTDTSWQHSTIIKGKVTAHRENIRRTDVSAKYTVKARAVQQPAADGMSKLTDLFSAMIEPINTDNQYMKDAKSLDT
jgi:hypothetical protein